MKRMTIADRAPAICSEEGAKTKGTMKRNPREEMRGREFKRKYWIVERCGVCLSEAAPWFWAAVEASLVLSISTLFHNGPQLTNVTAWLKCVFFFFSLLANACVCVGGQHKWKSIGWVFFNDAPYQADVNYCSAFNEFNFWDYSGLSPQAESNMLIKMNLMGNAILPHLSRGCERNGKCK